MVTIIHHFLKVLNDALQLNDHGYNKPDLNKQPRLTNVTFTLMITSRTDNVTNPKK